MSYAARIRRGGHMSRGARSLGSVSTPRRIERVE